MTTFPAQSSQTHPSSPRLDGAAPRRQTIAVVIPCYRVSRKIVSVAASALEYADWVIAVDDCCPEQSGKVLRDSCTDPRVRVLFHEANQGVGGAMVTGFQAALDCGADIIVKMDGDGQMNAHHLPRLVGNLRARRADIAKGNRFFDIQALQKMPALRRVGNLGLTFLVKAASGFWHISDPTNGYLAIRRGALELIDFDKLSRRYFFEISLLIRLNIIGATALDVPIPARYEDEKSSLNPWRVLISFPWKLLQGALQRIWWRYFVYDINIVTVFLVTGSLLFFGGAALGAMLWLQGHLSNFDQSAGTVALVMLPMIMGFQMLLQAIVLDMRERPSSPISDIMEEGAALPGPGSGVAARTGIEPVHQP